MFLNQAYAGTLPIQGTDVAVKWDMLYDFLVGLSVFFFVLIVGAMILFAIQYRTRPGIKTKYITDNHLIEGIWIVVPTILLLMIFGWGWVVYRDMTQVPADAYEIRVIGRQWNWQFQYDNGSSLVGQLVVPMNRPVKLVMTSEDVLHDFFIPNFRIKQDVVPGMYTSVWFEAKVPGKHQVYCAEYCGTTHSGMLAQLIALNDDQWKAWYGGKKIDLDRIPVAGQELADSVQAQDVLDERAGVKTSAAAPIRSLAEQGKALAETKGCNSCHSADGSMKVGPSFKGLFGHTVQFVDGTSGVADDNYLRESIEKPQAKVVRGFNPVMPTFKGLVSESEMNALIAYIKETK
jgi:cytochrome c oxidase subunit 2